MPYTYNDKTVNPINYDVTDVVKMNTFNEKEYNQQIAILEAYISKLDREIEDVEKRIESRKPKDKWHELAIQKYIDTGDMSGIAEYERYMKDAELRQNENEEREAKEQEYKDAAKEAQIEELLTQYDEAVNNAFAAKKEYDSTKSAADKAEFKNQLIRVKSIIKKLDNLGAEYELQSLPSDVEDEDPHKNTDLSYDEIATKINNLFADERFENDAARQKAVDEAEEYMKQLPDTYKGKVDLRDLIDDNKNKDTKVTVKKKKEDKAAKAKAEEDDFGY